MRQRLGRFSSLRRTWAPGPRQAAALLAAGVVALGLHGMVFYSSLRSRLPSALDWRAAAALLARDARAGDAVALSPWWAERAREVLPASLPVLAFPRLAGEDLLGVRRVWLLALPRAPGHRFDVEDDLVARASAVDGPQRLGSLDLSRYELRQPALPLAYLPDRLAGAEVRVGDRPCLPDGQRGFRCPAMPSVVVAREVREVDGLPRPCLYTHPSPDHAHPLTITFPAVPMGRILRGHTGIVGEAALAGEAPVHLAVKIEDQDVGAFEEPPATPGWHPFQLDTSSHSGRARAVTFAITATDVTQRHFCFDAYTLP